VPSLTYVWVLCSPLISMFFANETAGHLAAALGVPVIIYAICAQPIAMLTRNLRFRALAVIDAASIIAGFLGVLLWALFSPSPWAIYFGCITTTLAFAIGAFVAAAPCRPLMPDQRHKVYDLLSQSITQRLPFCRSTAGMVLNRIVKSRPKLQLTT
jgi:polysaccharide transporter, PST family